MVVAQKVSKFLTRFFRKYELVGDMGDIFSLGFVNLLYWAMGESYLVF